MRMVCWPSKTVPTRKALPVCTGRRGEGGEPPARLRAQHAHAPDLHHKSTEHETRRCREVTGQAGGSAARSQRNLYAPDRDVCALKHVKSAHTPATRCTPLSDARPRAHHSPLAFTASSTASLCCWLAPARRKHTRPKRGTVPAATQKRLSRASSSSNSRWHSSLRGRRHRHRYSKPPLELARQLVRCSVESRPSRVQLGDERWPAAGVQAGGARQRESGSGSRAWAPVAQVGAQPLRAVHPHHEPQLERAELAAQWNLQVLQ